GQAVGDSHDRHGTIEVEPDRLRALGDVRLVRVHTVQQGPQQLGAAAQQGLTGRPPPGDLPGDHADRPFHADRVVWRQRTTEDVKPAVPRGTGDDVEDHRPGRCLARRLVRLRRVELD